MTFLTVVAGGVILLDQLTKFLVTRFLQQGQTVPAGGAVGLCYTLNRGGIFGSFAGARWGPIVFPIIAVIAIVLILIYIVRVREKTAWMRLGFALVLGGAVGNLIDRLRPDTGRGVIDFIKLWIWPVFNVADASICVGVGLLLLDLAFRKEGPTPSEERELIPAPPREESGQGDGNPALE